MLVRDAVGDLDHAVRGHGAVLGVAAPGHPHDAVAFLEAQIFGAVALDLGDHARRLLSDHQGKAARGRVHPDAEVGVDVVDAGEVVLDQDLPVRERRHRVVFGVCQDVGIARLVNEDRLLRRGDRGCRCHSEEGGGVGRGFRGIDGMDDGEEGRP